MSIAAPALERLGKSKYVLLTTFRRDGTPVATPVWAVLEGQALMVWTQTESFKVKRIRRNGGVTVAECTFRGKLLGPALSGRASIMDADGTRRTRRLIKKKYWLTGPPLVNLSVWRRGEAGTVGVQITFD